MRQLFDSQVQSTCNSSEVAPDFCICFVDSEAKNFGMELGTVTSADHVRCHLLILLSRWQLFRESFVASREQHNNCNDEQMQAIVKAKIDSLKQAGGITVHGMSKEDFLNMLCFMYCNTFLNALPNAPKKKDSKSEWRNKLMTVYTAAAKLRLDSALSLVIQCTMRERDSTLLSKMKWSLHDSFLFNVFERVTDSQRTLPLIGDAMDSLITNIPMESA